MRQTLFYLTIALLAFGIGLSLVVNFYWKKDIEQNLPVKQTETEKIIENNIIGESNEKAEEDKFINDRINAFFPIITSWFKKKKIDEYVEIKSAGLRARAKLFDINGDKIEELAIQTNCAAVGNCELWVFQKYMDGFNVILKAETVQTFELKKTKTNGTFDLETKSHNDAYSGEINIYKFSQKEYKVSECFEYNYSDFMSEKLIKLKNPVMTPRDCN